MILAVFAVLIVLFVVLPLIGVAFWWLISTAVVGLVIGALGRLVVPGAQRIGVMATIACGLAGALLGGAVGRAVGGGRLVTILVEIGVAAGAVAVWETVEARRLPGSRRAISR
ncbi:MAG TPA: GlsB/YeaQ/YmgE family stress response membrane protein [Mycobacteriales bacterium]|nr:GlsB/YeaQ/YmgE family stress response membrane protein [Mycobacteriales bacterium]